MRKKSKRNCRLLVVGQLWLSLCGNEQDCLKCRPLCIMLLVVSHWFAFHSIFGSAMHGFPWCLQYCPWRKVLPPGDHVIKLFSTLQARPNVTHPPRSALRCHRLEALHVVYLFIDVVMTCVHAYYQGWTAVSGIMLTACHNYTQRQNLRVHNVRDETSAKNRTKRQ